MPSMSIGDLAQSFFLQRRGAALKTEQNLLTHELATGQVSDVKSRLAGNVSYLSGIERDIKALRAYQIAATEAGQFTDAMQNAFSRVQQSSSDLATAILRVGESTVQTVVPQISRDAKIELSNVISAINGEIAGRSLFSGAATDVAPLASADDLLSELRTVLSGAISVDDMVAAAEAWFDDPAGFNNLIYNGSSVNMPAVRVNVDTALSHSVRADDPVLKDVLMHTALVALASDPAMMLDDSAQRELLLLSGEGMLADQDALTAMRGNIGFVEQRIENASVRNASELTSLQFAKGSFLEADPYETATNLENIQFQLQSLYQITVRMSELSLGNYMR